jgi:hypothetical protein
VLPDRDHSPEQLGEAIHRLARGGKYISETLAERKGHQPYRSRLSEKLGLSTNADLVPIRRRARPDEVKWLVSLVGRTVTGTPYKRYKPVNIASEGHVKH